jgi:uncharacterized protein (TIGR00725 family)
VIQKTTLIGVIGGAHVSEEVAEQAREVGYAIGRRGLSLVCGGRTGVMEAACRGLRQARLELGNDCVSIGILPGEDAVEANFYVDFALPTGMGVGRNILVVRAASAVIAVDGSSGTLSELAYAWQLGKPVIALATSGGVAEQFAGKTIDSRRDDKVISASTPAEAVELALEEIMARSPG